MKTEQGIKIGMAPPHPGLFLQTEVIEELGLELCEISDILGVPVQDVSDLLNGKCALSPEMALRMEKAFGIGMEMTLKLQAWYDTEQMRARADEVKVKRYQPSA